MKKVVVSLLLVLLMSGLSHAPKYKTVRKVIHNVRILAYSPKQPREGHRLSNGKSARNEVGCAAPKGFLPYGTLIILPTGERRIIDDRSPERAVNTLRTRKFCEPRYYQRIKSKPKTRQVNKELRNKYDMGTQDIFIETRVEDFEM